MSKMFSMCIAKHAGTGSCSKYLGGKFCTRHWGQHHHGIIDDNGKKLRDPKEKKVFPECLAKDAGTGPCSTVKDGRFCKKHRGQFYAGIIDEKGNKLRDFHYRIKYTGECLAKNAGTGECSKHPNGLFCIKHREQRRAGIIDEKGNKLRDPKYKKRPSEFFTAEKKPKFTECLAKNSGVGECSKFPGRIRRFCVRHGAHYRYGIIDKDGKKQRDFKPMQKFSECVAKDRGFGPCNTRRYGRFCERHGYLHRKGIIDLEGHKIEGKEITKKRDLKDFLVTVQKVPHKKGRFREDPRYKK